MICTEGQTRNAQQSRSEEIQDQLVRYAVWRAGKYMGDYYACELHQFAGDSTVTYVDVTP